MFALLSDLLSSVIYAAASTYPFLPTTSKWKLSMKCQECRCDAVLTLQTEISIRLWDMFRYVMIAPLSLRSDKMLLFDAYKLLFTYLSRDSNCYPGIYEYLIRV